MVGVTVNGHAHTNGATAGRRPYPPVVSPEVHEARETYAIRDRAFQDPNARPCRVLGIGAGASGIVSLAVT